MNEKTSDDDPSLRIRTISMSARRRCEKRRGHALDLDIDAGTSPAGQRSFEGGIEFVDGSHSFAVAPQCHGDPIMTGRRRELAADQSIMTIFAQLDPMLRIPAEIVADHRDELCLVSDGGVEFQEMKTGRTVAHHRHDRGLRTLEGSRQCLANPATDGTERAIDDTGGGMAKGLGPLTVFTSVADQNRIVGRIQQSLYRSANETGVKSSSFERIFSSLPALPRS